ncbi:MAG: ABC transporter ATP-binding protein/permease [Treponema sp.]|nr:ABC transporter ATP-binding protein/permease [Treponema sp.]
MKTPAAVVSEDRKGQPDFAPQIFGPPREKLKLRSYVLKYPRQFFKQAAGGIIYNTVVVFGQIFLGKTIDAANLVYQGKARLSFFYANLAAFLGVTLIFQLARYFKRYYMREIVNRMKCDIRAGLLSSLFQTPMAELSGEKVGDMMSRMIGDVEQVGASVQTTITEMWDTALVMVSYFTVCMVYSAKITLLAAIPIPLAVIIAQLLRRPLYSLSQKARKAASGINVYLQHNVSGISLLRLFGLEEMESRKFSKLLDEQLKWNVASSALQSGMLPLYILIATSGIVLVVGMGGEYVVNGRWTIGTFTAFLAMFSAMAVRTNVAAKVMNTWHGAKASWDRICEKMKEREKAAGPEYPGTGLPLEDSVPALRPDPAAAALEVHSLGFGYPSGDGPSVSGVSFCAEKGEIVGITGPVGCGKSALAAALSDLYPYSGEVYINGISLRDLGEARSRVIAYMDPDQFIFSDHVDFNVTLDRGAGDSARALALAEMGEDIAAFPDGVFTRLMERGVRISGGQRQRIALARACYGSQALIILDDPFSAVDINMERDIMLNLRKAAGERVILLFSHRLSMFPLTSRILVMDKGRIIQAGTHDELFRQEGLYREIYSAQEFMRSRGEEL